MNRRIVKWSNSLLVAGLPNCPRAARIEKRMTIRLSDDGTTRLNERGQAAIWGMLTMLLLVVIAGALVDVYRLVEARNWAYAVAQEAALRGVSLGRDWGSVTNGTKIRLDSAMAWQEALLLAQEEMDARQVTGYTIDVHVLPGPDGGTVPGFPPRRVRLGNNRGEWSSPEPAVGVYISLPVPLTLLKFIGLSNGQVSAFVSAGVKQP